MILLDTDHLTVLRHKRHSSHQTLVTRLRNAFDTDIATTIISVEEQMRGWMAAINRVRDFEMQLDAYQRLHQLIHLLSHWTIIPADDAAVSEFDRLKSLRIRIGTQDMKIASIALAHDALLLTANQLDFEKVPGMRFENWLVSDEG